MGFFRGHNTTIRENKISNFTVTTAEYGSTVPEILGTTRIAPNIIYYDDFAAHEHRESQKTGKGWRWQNDHHYLYIHRGGHISNL